MTILQEFFNTHPLRAAERVKPPHSTSKVLGGEGAVWTEFIDAHNFECRTWPRAGIIATKLWGDITGNIIRVTTENIFAAVTAAGRRPKATEVIPVSPNTLSQSLHMSYIRFRYYLQQKGVKASAISLHLTNVNTNTLKYTPMFRRSENELLRHWLQDTSTFISNKTDQLLKTKHKMVSQCPDVPEPIQRPVWHRGSGNDIGSDAATPILKGVFLNVAEGGHEARRRKELQQWLGEQADAGVSFIGLCELNGWQQLESTSEFKYNFPRIRRIASESGFSYSHVMTSSQPYNIGIISAVAFDIVAEYLPPIFQRGLLHVFFPSLRLHVFITHLHAHSSHLREQESTFLATLVEPLIQQNEMKVLVMGDLNTLYEEDKNMHGVWSSLFHQEVSTGAPSPLIQRLKKKFCVENSTEINYRPLGILTDVGLQDSCTDFCRVRRHVTARNSQDQSYCPEAADFDNYDEEDFQQCYEDYCSYSEPTSYNPEVQFALECVVRPHNIGAFVIVIFTSVVPFTCVASRISITPFIAIAFVCSGLTIDSPIPCQNFV